MYCRGGTSGSWLQHQRLTLPGDDPRIGLTGMKERQRGVLLRGFRCQDLRLKAEDVEPGVASAALVDAVVPPNKRIPEVHPAAAGPPYLPVVDVRMATILEK